MAKSINFKNYQFSTKGVWKACKMPTRQPDYISYTKKGKFSSAYWYGENKRGKYIIRYSDHWSDIRMPLLNRGDIYSCGSIGTCWWIIRGQYSSESCAKTYLKNLNKYYKSK